MRKQLILSFARAGTLDVVLPADQPLWSAEQARRWLDDRFVALECEPLRASGKLLMADKVLAVSAALGHRQLAADETLRLQLAQAVLAALGQSLVTVDVDALSVTF